MSSSRSWTVALALMVCLTGASCKKDKRTPTTPVDTPPPPTVIEMFSGAIALGETSCNLFEVMETGDVTMKLTELAPLGTLTVGVGVGTEDSSVDTGCSLFASDRSVRVLEKLVSGGLNPGVYCVCVFDVGNIFPDQTVTYTVEVEHP